MKNDNGNIIEKIVSNVVDLVNPNWNKLQKIRFVYLKLGEYLEKNTDFFLNDKLNEFGLSEEEFKAVYQDDLINVSERNNTDLKYQVICKSAAMLLKKAFDKLEIESYLVKTVESYKGVKHWFLTVSDDEFNYFLTLAVDLPYIKNNLPTKHFANNISYINQLGNQIYDKEEEIPHRVLTFEELKELDKSIGYQKLYDSTSLITRKNFNDLYERFLETNSIIYKTFIEKFHIQDDLAKKVGDIKESEYLSFVNEIKNYYQDNLCKKMNITTDGEFGKNVLLKIFESFNIHVDDRLSTKDLLNKYKKDIKKIKDQEYFEIISLIKCIIGFEDLFKKYFILKNEYTRLTSSLKEKENIFYQNSNDEELRSEIVFLMNQINLIENDYIYLSQRLSLKHFTSIIKKIIDYDIKDELVIKNPDDYVSAGYIANKLYAMFPLVMDANSVYNDTVSWNSFSVQNYSEQIVIVKELLKIMFAELTYNNSKDMEGYDDKYSVVENRIQTFPLKDMETGEYCIGFFIGKQEDEDEYYFIYVPSENTFKEFDYIVDAAKYWVVSSRFNENIVKVEDIELDEDIKSLR